MKYHVEMYLGGIRIVSLNTDDKKDIVKLFEKYGGEAAIRVWVDGRKLTYTEIDRLFLNRILQRHFGLV